MAAGGAYSIHTAWMRSACRAHTSPGCSRCRLGEGLLYAHTCVHAHAHTPGLAPGRSCSPRHCSSGTERVHSLPSGPADPPCQPGSMPQPRGRGKPGHPQAARCGWGCPQTRAKQRHREEFSSFMCMLPPLDTPRAPGALLSSLVLGLQQTLAQSTAPPRDARVLGKAANDQAPQAVL